MDVKTCFELLAVTAIGLSSLAAGCGADAGAISGEVYVLFWEGVQREPGGPLNKWVQQCRRIHTRAGKQAVRDWIEANRQALERPPHALSSVPTTPPKYLYLVRDGQVVQHFRLWLYMPQGPVSKDASAIDLLLRVEWKTNLPTQEFERLKAIFRKHGEALAVVPNLVPQRLDSDSVLRRLPQGGRYVLRMATSPDGCVGLGPTLSYEIDASQGRRALENWMVVHYEGLQRCELMVPGAVTPPPQELFWIDDKDKSFAHLLLYGVQCVGLLSANGDFLEGVENVPGFELERLTRVFQEHGQRVTFDPDPLCHSQSEWVRRYLFR